MFLATTALSEFWETEEKVLLLGRWCFPHDKHNELEGLSYEVLPYPWYDRDEKYRAHTYCSQIYENILPDIAEYCNRLHGEDFGLRYWRIMLGEWMWRYVQIIYDRYFCLKRALDQYSDITTFLLNVDSYRYVRDNLEFLQLCGSYSDTSEDVYNLQLYSNILSLLGYHFPSKSYIQPHSSISKKNRITPNIIKLYGKKLIELKKYLDFKYAPSAQVVYTGIFYDRINYLREIGKKNKAKYRQLHLGFNDSHKMRPDKKIRQAFGEMTSSDLFQEICLKMMEFCFPMIFIEGYKHLKKKASGFTRNIPEVILSSISWRFDTASAFYIADCVEKGSKLVGLQHGGGYGLYALDSMLENELRVVDNYCSWGWNDNNSKITPWPWFNIHDTSRNKDNIKKRPILFTSNSTPRYLTIFQSSPVGSTMEDYYLWQKRFFLCLKDEVRTVFMYRPYLHELGWGHMIKNALEGIRYDDLKVPFRERVKRSRLVVIDNNQTTLLEAFALNVPTVIFWDMNVWEIRESAKFFFDDLRAVNVFHDTPESAAGFINDHYETIEEWWSRADVQQVVESFRHSYARTSKDIVGEWGENIASMLNID